MRLVSVAVLALAVAPAAFAQQGESARLKACIEKIDTDAEGAYQDALTWLGQGNRPMARQCAALALIGLKQEAEGAARLEELANAPDGGSLDARAVYLAQSGNAWLLARMPDAAVVTLTNAIKLKPDDAELRKDRGRAYIMLKKWEQAGEDFNSALNLSPGNGEALRLRALVLVKMERLQEAWEDVELALKFSPKDVDAAVLRGDIREAMRKKGMADPAGLDDPAPDVSPKVVGN
jgi:tetratricopeptide (TPR) repeat protein